MTEIESNAYTSFHSHVFLGEGHEKSERRTWAVIWLCAAMMLLEIVGDQGDRAEQPAPDDLEQHHGGAEPDDGPGSALAFFVPLAEEDVAMERWDGGAFGFGHGGPHLR